MTKPVSRKMAVDTLLSRIATDLGNVEGVLRLICQECKEPLLPGQEIDFDHVHQVATGGAHSYDRLRPIHRDPCHRKHKNARDARARSKIRKIAGQNKPKPKTKIDNRPFQKVHRPFRRKRANDNLTENEQASTPRGIL